MVYPVANNTLSMINNPIIFWSHYSLATHLVMGWVLKTHRCCREHMARSPVLVSSSGLAGAGSGTELGKLQKLTKCREYDI